MFENFSFDVDFMLDQTGVLFWVTQYCVLSENSSFIFLSHVKTVSFYNFKIG